MRQESNEFDPDAPRNQEDIVRASLNDNVVTQKVGYPNADKVHTLPVNELADILARVIKSRPNVVEFRYVLGDGFYLTYEKPSPLMG